VKIILSIFILSFALVSTPSWTRAQDAAQANAKQPDIATLNADAAQAKQRVIEIINQPVTHLPRTRAAGTFSPGWFHPGAITPDFNTVDVRTTQEFPYDSYSYVTSDLNPSEMFIGSELEFNAMTKYFYTDRTLPKKRLSEAEMIEINSLYRIIGRDEQALATRRKWTGLFVVALFLAVPLLLLVRRTL
jgi:hypothetical protein